MIILEGTDLVGKTTLAKLLTKRLKKAGYPMKLQHMSKPKDGFDFVWGYYRDMGCNIVQDRFHLGELAYGSTIYGCRQTVEQFRIVEGALALHGAVVVLITATHDWYDRNWQDIVKKYNGRDEMFRLEQVKVVNAFYRDQLQPIWKPHIDYEIALWPTSKYPAEDPLHVDNIIKLWLERQKVRREVESRGPTKH